MSEEQQLFVEVGRGVADSIESQMFGSPCFKMGKKAFVCFFGNQMVFKLTGDSHTEALCLDGSQLFDPSGKGRAMKEWVQVPFDYKNRWAEFALAAANYVGG